MSYRINKFDGTVLTDVVDGTIDQVTTDLTLVGSDVSGYGELMNENFVHLLENFADTESPPNPIIGQLWYDLSESLLKIYDGSSFTKVAGSIIERSDTTVSQKPGDIWIQSDKNQLFFHDGSKFRLAGPLYTQEQGVSGFQVVTSQSTNLVDHTVVCLWCKNNLIGIISNDSFEPSSSIFNYTGVVKAGFTFINPDPVNNEFNLNLDKLRFYRNGTFTDNYIRLGRSIDTFGPSITPSDPTIDPVYGYENETDNDIVLFTHDGNINVKGSRITTLHPPETIYDAVNAGWIKITISRDITGYSQADAINIILHELRVLSPVSDYFDSTMAKVLCHGNDVSYVVTCQIQNNEWVVVTDSNGDPIIQESDLLTVISIIDGGLFSGE